MMKSGRQRVMMWGSVQGPDHKSADIQVKDGGATR